MKVLVCAGACRDYAAAGLLDGFRELFGPESVYQCPRQTLWLGDVSPAGKEVGDEADFDLLIVSSSFTQQTRWEVPLALRKRLARGGKVAYLDIHDESHAVLGPLDDLAADAVFRVVIDTTHHYPYSVPVHRLHYAAPAAWLEYPWGGGRPFDVFYGGQLYSHPFIREALFRLMASEHPDWSLVVAQGLSFDDYAHLMRRSELTLVMPGPGGRVATTRTFEAAAFGAVPVFVGGSFDDRPFGYDAKTSFSCQCWQDVPCLVRAALDRDLDAMRDRLRNVVLEWHTTRARASWFLKTMGF